ncbi:hypothetical protein VST7929_00507 [Vibrio stylophorae]|uniref:DUF3545 domain-containing protein n=1 Tax=Vibrio stylophorae TaxID=659351 RepID=A0ABM8ZQU7_9VIBR|nr:DUF3545 family protein [Vibrio stylophorae]CAH0532666.1 hypothetical protein VST7929_00507 [Vibrio stylophorae]
MDDLMFEDFIDERASRAQKKPAKRMWREIEALKDKQRLRKELAGIDLLDECHDDIDFL